MVELNLFGTLPLIVIWLALGFLGILLQAFVRSSRIVFGYYSLTLIATAAMALLTHGQEGTMFFGMISLGGYAAYFDFVFCMIGLMAMMAARPYLKREESEYDEFYTLMVSSVAGMMFMAHSNNLLVTFIGIELMSISFYVLAGFFRKQISSIEASLKYFLLGAFASGFLVYGMALVYGATGSLEYHVIADVIKQGQVAFPTLLAIGATLIVVGFSFKVAAFPFHQWAPDVYTGAPTVVTAFMSTAGKAAAFSAMVPLFIILMPPDVLTSYSVNLRAAIAVISAITMLIGNISAVVQTNVKRMLAYSSVAHAGYLLMGIVAGTPAGYNGIVFYVTVYAFMQLGAFVVVGLLERGNERFLQIEDYAGLGRQQPVVAALMAMFMFSLTGIPPFAGFFGKYILFVAAIESGYTWLTLVAVLSSVISAYFYIGLIVKMYFVESNPVMSKSSPGLAAIALGVSAAVVLFLGVFQQFVWNIYTLW